MNVILFGNRIFTVDLLWGFQQAGHKAWIIQATTAKQMEEALGEADVDILLTLGAPLEFKREVLDFLGNRQSPGYKHIHWDTDGISSTMYRSVSGDGIEMDFIYAAKPDLVLSMCPDMRDFIQQKGLPCEIMHYAYSPVSHRPLKGYDNDKYYINLVGNSYYSFAKYYPNHYRYQSLGILLKPLLENGYTVNFRGDNGYRPLIKEMFGIDVPAEDFHGYLPYEKTCAAYNSSFVNLVTQNHEHTITKRTFEILGSGGFALSSDNAAIRELFVPGRDLAVSSSPEQTLELVRYYKEHPDEWRKVRDSAVLSVQNHTYKQRAEFIVQKYQEYWP
jgi:spore maturation protein CgeB